MDPQIQKQLEQEDPTDFHKALLTHVRGLVDMSRRRMAKQYPIWDKHDQTYRGERASDQQDLKARDRKEPEKMVVPLSYSQVQTFIAFCFAVYYQRSRMFELNGMNVDGHKAAKIAEAVLERDLNHNIFDARLYQFLLDLARFGIGVVKTGWVHEKQMMDVEIEGPPVTFMGFTVKAGAPIKSKQETTKYLGNKITNISPYRFFPDVRLPISRFQEGEFCASEDEVSMTSLYQMQHNGAIAGVKFIKPMTKKTIEDDKDRPRRLSFVSVDQSLRQGSNTSAGVGGSVILTECQVSLIPSKFMLDGKTPLGPEDYPVKWNVWYVNDGRIIKAEPLGYVHDEYTYDVAEFAPDMHNLLNSGLCGTIDMLQSVISWFINSHITSVRKTIQNWLVVDPRGINMDDIDKRSSVIRVTDNASQGSGVDRWIKQLAVQDVTQGHVQDSQFLFSLLQVVTGINDNALGQFHSGRRSATEARNVNVAAASRLKVIAQLAFRTALEPMARKMLSNLRDGLDVPTFVKLVGPSTAPDSFVQFSKVSKDELVGEYDFEVFDGTLPTERFNQAGTLQELVSVVMQNPNAMQFLGYDPRKLIREVLELRGVKNPERFQFEDANEMLALQQQAQETQNGLLPTQPGDPAVGAGGGVLPFAAPTGQATGTEGVS